MAVTPGRDGERELRVTCDGLLVPGSPLRPKTEHRGNSGSCWKTWKRLIYLVLGLITRAKLPNIVVECCGTWFHEWITLACSCWSARGHSASRHPLTYSWDLFHRYCMLPLISKTISSECHLVRWHSSWWRTGEGFGCLCRQGGKGEWGCFPQLPSCREKGEFWPRLGGWWRQQCCCISCDTLHKCAHLSFLQRFCNQGHI